VVNAYLMTRPRLTQPTLNYVKGKLPSKVLSLVVEWAAEHQNELVANWESIRVTGKFHKVSPLA
jgi:hypothetical protein